MDDTKLLSAFFLGVGLAFESLNTKPDHKIWSVIWSHLDQIADSETTKHQSASEWQQQFPDVPLDLDKVTRTTNQAIRHDQDMARRIRDAYNQIREQHGF